MRTPFQGLPLGPLCFLVLGIAIGVRVLSCFLPCEIWGVSGYQCAAAYLSVPTGVSHTWFVKSAIPEGARLSNRLDFLSFRPERFTVDERGFRNGPSHRATQPQAVLIGSSFSLGMALSDEQTFCSRINQQIGDVVYNASGTVRTEWSADDIVRTAREGGLERGLVVLEVLNRVSFVYNPRPTGLRDLYERAPETLKRKTAPAVVFARRVNQSVGLTRLSTLLNMRLHDDHILPNPYKDMYSEEQLITGRRVLMFSGDKMFSQKPASPDITADTVKHLTADLAPLGYRLAVVLLPNAYSVYYPLVMNHETPDASEDYMNRLYIRMVGDKVPVLNLLPILRSAARAELSEDRLIYYPDDAHWNPRGSDIAARAAAPWIDSLLGGQVNRAE